MDARVVFVENSPSVGAREACVRAIYSISTRNELDTLFHLYAQNPLVSSLFVLSSAYRTASATSQHIVLALRPTSLRNSPLSSILSTPEAPTMAAAAQSCRPLLEAGSYACFVVYIQADAHV